MKYRSTCSCGMSSFFKKSDVDKALENKDNYQDIWCTYIRRGYPSSRAHKIYNKNVSSCASCLDQLGVSKSGTPYIIENLLNKIKKLLKEDKKEKIEELFYLNNIIYVRNIFNLGENEKYLFLFNNNYYCFYHNTIFSSALSYNSNIKNLTNLIMNINDEK